VAQFAWRLIFFGKSWNSLGGLRSKEDRRGQNGKRDNRKSHGADLPFYTKTVVE
jgi:hypothetical protein